MANLKPNIIKVKVYPKDLKAIPDVLPFNKLIQGDPVELELDKREILRCMNFGDVYDLTSGEEVLINELSFKDIEEFVEDEDSEDVESDTEAPVEAATTNTSQKSEPVTEPTETEDI